MRDAGGAFLLRQCDGCRFCCWSFNVDVPHPTLLTVIEPKRELRHCHHECEQGCALHDDEYKPSICRNFKCPYIYGEPVHKPNTFQELLEAISGNMGNYIPAVSSSVPVADARRLIESSRSLPAYILVGNQWSGRWIYTILPLDKDVEGGWETKSTVEWEMLYEQYGVGLNLTEQITI